MELAEKFRIKDGQPQYLFCSMAGSYWADCEILSGEKDYFVIEYFDVFLDKFVTVKINKV